MGYLEQDVRIKNSTITGDEIGLVESPQRTGGGGGGSTLGFCCDSGSQLEWGSNWIGMRMRLP
jgi:hypothetical protein